MVEKKLSTRLYITKCCQPVSAQLGIVSGYSEAEKGSGALKRENKSTMRGRIQTVSWGSFILSRVLLIRAKLSGFPRKSSAPCRKAWFLSAMLSLAVTITT